MRLIDADALKEWIDEYVSVFKKSDNKDIKGYIEHQPTIEPKRGEWIDKDGVKKCNLCGWLTTNQGYAFCPNCGADMRIVESQKICGNCAFVDNDPNFYPCRYCAEENRIYWRAEQTERNE